MVTQRELLDILPNLYNDLCSYQTSFIKFDGPAVKSLSKFWQPPFQKECSPYGVEVMRSLQDYTITCDQEMMNQCLQDVTREMALSLKQQRGNAYGFGDDDCSEDRILMNLPDELLDDPDAVHSKPVENFLGDFKQKVLAQK